MKWNIPLLDTQVTGVEVIINPDGSCSYGFCVLKKAGDQLQTLASANSITIEELFKEINAGHPVSLSINGKGILHKHVTAGSNETVEAVFEKVLPNTKPEDFYTQLFNTGETTTILSFIRKSVLNPILLSFSDKGLKVIACILGPFSIQAAIPLIAGEADNFELTVLNHELNITNRSINNYTQLQLPENSRLLKQSDFEINTLMLIAFSAAFSFFNPINQLTSNFNELTSALSEFRYELKFKKASIIILGALLAILTFNFIVYSYLLDEVKLKANKALTSRYELDRMDSLKTQLEKRNNFLDSNGFFNPSRNSYYADQIAMDIPETISLTAINLLPLKKNADDKIIEFDSKKIVVSGNTLYSLDVNEWIKKIRKQPWVNTIVMLDYSQKEGRERGDFTFVINLK